MKDLYFVAFLIPLPMGEQINVIRQSISTQFDCHHALKSPPHITVHMPFRIESKEFNSLADVVAKIERPESFEVQIGGIKHFDERTIYIDVDDQPELTAYRNRLQENLSESLSIPKEKRAYFKPHITLANRDIKPMHFDDILHFAQKQTLSTVCSLKEVSILRHDGKIWKEVRKF